MNMAGLRVIAWGLLLLIVNINIGLFYIFPNWLGYILILVGANQLKNQLQPLQYWQFQRASQFAAALLLIGLIKTFVAFINNLSIIFTLLEIIAALLLITVIYYLFTGIYHIAQSLQQNIFAQKVRRNWLFFFIVQIITLAVTPYMQSLSSEPVLIILLVFLAVIAMLLIIFTLFKAARLQFPTEEHHPH